MISKYSKILIGNEVVGNDLQSKKTTLNEWYKAGKKKRKRIYRNQNEKKNEVEKNSNLTQIET